MEEYTVLEAQTGINGRDLLYGFAGVLFFFALGFIARGRRELHAYELHESTIRYWK